MHVAEQPMVDSQRHGAAVNHRRKTQQQGFDAAKAQQKQQQNAQCRAQANNSDFALRTGRGFSRMEYRTGHQQTDTRHLGRQGCAQPGKPIV